MKISKKEFLNKLTEDLNQVNQGQPGKSPNFLSTVTNPNVMKTATDNVTKLTDLKKKADSAGITNTAAMAEEFDAAKEYPNKIEYLKAMIDHLMDDRFGVTYFNNQGDPNILQHKLDYSPEFASFYNRLTSVKREMDSNPERSEQALNGLYLGLQDYIQKKKMNEDYLVNSEMFRIIAEAENPKLTKSDFITFIKNKYND